MSDNGIARVRYFERQFLRAADFVDEQAYHLAMHRRHNIAAHSWGIVNGLDLQADPAGNLKVNPGLAVDGYGRELVLPEPFLLNKDAQGRQVFDQNNSNVLDIWLVYARQETDATPEGYAGCAADALNTSNRARESGTVLLLPPNRQRRPDPLLDIPQRRQPTGVPSEDLKFPPYRDPPDDPLRSWPVFLGQITRTTAGAKVSFSINPSGRPYAGLIGEEIRAASGLARMQIGAADRDDRHRFAVFVDPAEGDPAGAQNQALDCDCDAESGACEPRLAIDDDGEIFLRGDTTLYGDLTIDGGAVEFQVGYVAQPQPWSIYRTNYSGPTQAPAGGAAAPTAQVAATQQYDELRIEMAPHKAGKSPNHVVIGVWSDGENRFMPCLTVADDCTVTIAGNLIVTGSIKGTINKPPVDSGNSPAAATSLVGARLAGMQQRIIAEDLQQSRAQAATTAGLVESKIAPIVKDVIGAIKGGGTPPAPAGSATPVAGGGGTPVPAPPSNPLGAPPADPNK